MFYDPIPLNVASFDPDAGARDRRGSQADGVTPPVGPAVLMSNVVASAIHTPRSVNWNLELDREWFKNFFVRVGYQQRDNRFESVLDPVTSRRSATSALVLRTDGRSRYREGQITARYQFHGADQIVGSYTRSSAVGNLNDFNSYFGNIENPVIRPDAQRAACRGMRPTGTCSGATLSLPRGFTRVPGAGRADRIPAVGRG